MTLTLLHTADWHLGHTLNRHDRSFEHQRFLDWLVAHVEAEPVDALVVAGDVFDTANPPAPALRLWYATLARLRRALPALDLVIVGGNHDSAARLEAPGPLFDELGVRVVGALPSADDPERAVVPLRDRGGQVAGWLGAVPFLRVADLPAAGGSAAGGTSTADPLVEGVRACYGAVVERLRAARSPGQALVLTGHGYMTGGHVSELSERKVLGGNQHALPLDVFPADVAYVALGHLHLAQEVGGARHVRYSGSPIPLSMGELTYPHQVVRVTLDGERLAEVRSVAVPRGVELLRIPAEGALGAADLLAAVEALPPRARPEHERPFLEVALRLEAPDPAARERVLAALATRDVRLVRLRLELAGRGGALADAVDARGLEALAPEEVFRRCYARQHEGEPPAELLAAFHELVGEAAAATGEPSP